MTSQQTVDIVMSALCCWREASSELQEVRIGVLWVMRNRMLAHWTPQATMQDVCEQPWQFSSMTAPGDVNLNRWPKSKEGSWSNCLLMAEAVVTGQIPDPTGRAVFYHDVSIPGPPAAWGDVIETVRLGRIIFYGRA